MSKPKSPSTPPGNEAEIFVRTKPEPIPFSKFLLNRSEGTVLGRTALSWGKHSISKLYQYLYIIDNPIMGKSC